MDTYDDKSQARDSVHFAKQVDRFFQNLRRVAGFDVQYFAAVEPQRRLAPHLHAAIRGTISRADIRATAAATYHQVWWPHADEVIYPQEHLPAWDEHAEQYVDPDTGQPLPTFDQACADLTEPMHVVRFGAQVHVAGVLADSPQSEKWLKYLVKYLHKSISDCHQAESDRQKEHLHRLWQALRFEPCSPRAPTGCATAYNPATRARVTSPATAAARCIARRPWASAAAASWSRASGRTRPWPSTAATSAPGCATCSPSTTTPTTAATWASLPRATPGCNRG